MHNYTTLHHYSSLGANVNWMWNLLSRHIICPTIDIIIIIFFTIDVPYSRLHVGAAPLHCPLPRQIRCPEPESPYPELHLYVSFLPIVSPFDVIIPFAKLPAAGHLTAEYQDIFTGHLVHMQPLNPRLGPLFRLLITT